jgi:CrcB protein
MLFYLSIVLAGGLGALLRYLLGRATVNVGLTALPFGTLFANILGCFFMGYFSWLIVQKWQLPKEVQVVVLTGFLGGFTTFSAFSLELITLFEQGNDLRAAAYLGLTVFLCISMCMLGLFMAKQT